MADDLCEGCHYLMSGKISPTGLNWCGFMGGDAGAGQPFKMPADAEAGELAGGIGAG